MGLHFFSQFESISVKTYTPSFLTDTADADAYELFNTLVGRVKNILNRYTLRVATSFGKDSVLMLSVALQAQIECIKEGVIPADQEFYVSNIDTGVDDIYVRAQIAYEVSELTRYCELMGINLVYQTAAPTLRYSWSVMYLSGMKLPSFAKSSADCSVILKVDPAKELERSLLSTHENLVTLLGVRASESSRRAGSIKRHGLDDVNVFEQVTKDKKVIRTFAPIVDVETDDVFAILRRSGTNPIVKTRYKIPTYKAHNQLLIKLYGDAQDTCPVSSFQNSTGSESKSGSCGNGSRFGCYTCLKVVVDKSAESRQRFVQYDRTSKVKAIRDYMAHTSEDMSLRTGVGKSLCDVTGAIVVQENTYSAAMLEKLIYWFAQATRDDYLYAEQFKALVQAGNVSADMGYQEILNDASIEDEFRDFFLEQYVQMSQQHLIKPLGIEHILMLCAIHARDGVALPPYRALHIWNEVWNGNYIAWPTIAGERVCDDVPEPRFYIGNFKKTFRSGLLNPLMADDASCASKSVFEKSSDRLYLSQSVIGTDYVSVSGRAVSHVFTRRKITSKRGGQFRKGRMSVALGSVSPVFASLAGAEKRLTVLMPTVERSTQADINIWEQDEVDSGFSLDSESASMFLMTEYDRCLEKHDAFVARRGVVFGGTDAFIHMLSYGVIALTSRAQIASERMLARTEQLMIPVGDRGISLLHMSKEQLHEVTISQAEYRSERARCLLIIRKARIANAKYVKRLLALKTSNPAGYIRQYAEVASDVAKVIIQKCLHDIAYLDIVASTSIQWFDGIHLPTYKASAMFAISDIKNKLGTIDGVLGLLSLNKNVLAHRQGAAEVVDSFKGAIDSLVPQLGHSMLAMLAGAQCSDAAVFDSNFRKHQSQLKIVAGKKQIYSGKSAIAINKLSVLGL